MALPAWHSSAHIASEYQTHHNWCPLCRRCGLSPEITLGRPEPGEIYSSGAAANAAVAYMVVIMENVVIVIITLPPYLCFQDVRYTLSAPSELPLCYL